MTTDILGHPYRLGRCWADGSHPHHARSSCRGAACPWHAPSRHHMRTWPRVIRFNKYGLVERICPHGVGHPDPDSVAFIREFVSVHGCCPEACCASKVLDPRR